jgi:3'-5' exoribonuclease
MKELYVGTLVPNEVATAQFLVLSKDIRQKKTGEPYLSLHLADRTGEIEAKMWDNVAEIMESFDRDDFVKVKGVVQIYQNRSQLTIHKIRRLQDHEVDPADYFPCSERDPEDMFRELRSTIDGIGEPHLQALLNAFFDDPQLAALYKRAPAAKSIHHAYRGGLLEHVLSLCGLCRLCAAHYSNLDLDLLLTEKSKSLPTIEALGIARKASCWVTLSLAFGCWDGSWMRLRRFRPSSGPCWNTC